VIELRYSIGIDVGGTKIAGILIDENLNVLSYKKVLIGSDKVPNTIVKTIASLVETLKLNLEKSKLIGVGIVVPGVISLQDRMIVYSSNLGWENVPIANLIEREVELPCFLEHDVRGGAIAELISGYGKELQSFLYVSIGTGIAGTIIWNREILMGSQGMAGEIGHMIVQPSGPLCRCGKRGCLEAIASGSAMEREAFYITGKKVRGPIIAKRAKQGESPFQEIVKTSCFYLGIALANLATILDPEAILLGGGVSEAGEQWLQLVKNSYLHHLMNIGHTPRLLLSKYKGKASVMGAALIPFISSEKIKRIIG